MQLETGEPEIIERVAALDIGKARWCAARAPDPRGRRMQEVSTMTAALLGLADWLAQFAQLVAVGAVTSVLSAMPFRRGGGLR